MIDVPRHVPAVHVWFAGHALPHAPQWALLVCVLVSQPFALLPSQLAKPALQDPMVQTPFAQPGVAFTTPGHVVYIVSDLPDPAFRQVAESLVESRIAALVLAIQSGEITSRRE